MLHGKPPGLSTHALLSDSYRTLNLYLLHFLYSKLICVFLAGLLFKACPASATCGNICRTCLTVVLPQNHIRGVPDIICCNMCPGIQRARRRIGGWWLAMLRTTALSPSSVSRWHARRVLSWTSWRLAHPAPTPLRSTSCVTPTWAVIRCTIPADYKYDCTFFKH